MKHWIKWSYTSLRCDEVKYILMPNLSRTSPINGLMKLLSLSITRVFGVVQNVIFSRFFLYLTLKIYKYWYKFLALNFNDICKISQSIVDMSVSWNCGFMGFLSYLLTLQISQFANITICHKLLDLCKHVGKIIFLLYLISRVCQNCSFGISKN